MGWVEGGATTVVDALLESLGPAGNLMLPTFNYTHPLPRPCFDPAQTPCRTGAIPETARKQQHAVRSVHPTHSVVVFGPRADELTSGHLETRAFGVGSPLDRLLDLGGKILLLGVGHTSNSALHVVEEHAGRPKVPWSVELPEIKIRLPGGEMINHRIDTSPSCSTGFGDAEATLRAADAIQDVRVADARGQLVDGRSLRDAMLERILREPEALLCNRPDCVCCNGTRRLLKERS